MNELRPKLLDTCPDYREAGQPNREIRRFIDDFLGAIEELHQLPAQAGCEDNCRHNDECDAGEREHNRRQPT